jgi:shikimate kinase
MATGKSTVGRLIAQRAGCAFVDLDERIEARAGLKISELFAQRGERAFRQLEAEALEEVLEAGRREVVALGGGALLVRARRLKALDRAVVVGLSADVDETLRRAAAQPGQRPLLAAGSAAEHVEQLLEERANAYAECHARLDTTGRTPEELAARAFELWQRDGVAVAAAEHSY